jgi:hypothetical protein
MNGGLPDVVLSSTGIPPIPDDADMVTFSGTVPERTATVKLAVSPCVITIEEGEV